MIPLVLLRLLGVAREFCRRRLSLSAGVLVSGLAIALCAGVRLASRRSAPVVPPKLAARLASHAVATAAETVAIARAKREARADSVTAAQTVERARSHGIAAARAGRHADSLARSAEWQDAYKTRSGEVSELLTVDALRDTAVVAAEHRGAVLDAALQISEIRASRADSLLDESVQLLGQQTSCGFRCRVGRVAKVGVIAGGALIVWRLSRK